MKAILLGFCTLFCLVAASQNQCLCSIDPQYTEPGLYPEPDSFPCVIPGTCYDYTLNFVNFDSTTVSGIRVRLEYLIIDSILNLPCGFEWSTSNTFNDERNRFENKEKGCIRFGGTTNDSPGQYKLKIMVNAKLSLLPNVVRYNTEELGLRVDIRVVSDSALCQAIDTSLVSSIASCNSYDVECICDGRCICTGPGNVNTISSLSNFNFHPNPTNGSATVTFTADKAATYTARIINIFGAEVSREVLNVLPGEHKQLLDVADLPPGVYIYTLNDGAKVLARRFVVE